MLRTFIFVLLSVLACTVSFAFSAEDDSQLTGIHYSNSSIELWPLGWRMFFTSIISKKHFLSGLTRTIRAPAISPFATQNFGPSEITLLSGHKLNIHMENTEDPRIKSVFIEKIDPLNKPLDLIPVQRTLHSYDGFGYFFIDKNNVLAIPRIDDIIWCYFHQFIFEFPSPITLPIGTIYGFHYVTEWGPCLSNYCYIKILDTHKVLFFAVHEDSCFVHPHPLAKSQG